MLHHIREFLRLHELAAAAGEPVIPTPTTAMISSYSSHQRLLKRGGIPVGAVTLQPTTGNNDGYCLRCAIDSERGEPFFGILFSTKTLMDSFDSTRPIETDETYKVIHEGYALTLIGQSDMNRVWHIRYESLNFML